MEFEGEKKTKLIRILQINIGDGSWSKRYSTKEEVLFLMKKEENSCSKRKGDELFV